MNSPKLDNLEFTDLDRQTMETHIRNVHPHMYHRFRTTNKGFTYSSNMSAEILALFASPNK
jgi:hypothetical protein